MAIISRLETGRLAIVPFASCHLTERYVAWLNDKEVVRYSEQRHKPHTLKTCNQYWEAVKKSNNDLLAIEMRNLSADHIGNITISYDANNKVADISILIGEKALWGKGYGSEAFAAVCGFLLKDSDIRKVTSGTMATNEGMLGIMRHVGMQDDGYRKRAFLLDGKETGLVFGAIYRNESD